MSLSAPFLAWLAADAKTVGRRCLLIKAGVKHSGSEISRYLSDAGYTSEPADTPASQLYTGRIAGMSPYTRRLDLQGSGASISFAEFYLDNVDGALDDWINDIWAGRTIDAYLGDAGDDTRGIAKWPLSQFELMFSGTSDDITPKDRKTLTLKVRDIFGPLNDTFSTATIGGTGDNKDALRSCALGECFNVTPVLIDAATQKYGDHLNSAMEGTLEVRDNGVPVDYTDTAASGYFNLLAARFGQITCDVQGAKISGSYRNDAGGLVEWIATVLGDGNFITSGQIDATALTAFRSACAQPLGKYIADRGNRLQIMQELAASVGATVTTTYDGKLILVRVGFGSPVGAVGPRQMVEGTFAPIARPQVQGTIRLAGERNWTPQPASSLAGALTSSQLPILGDEFVTLSDTDATVVSNWYQNSAPAATETLMVVESDITDECTRRLNLWKVKRTIFGFDGFAECFQYEIGDTVTLTHPRFGLSGGVSAQIIGVQHDWLNARVRLEVLV